MGMYVIEITIKNFQTLNTFGASVQYICAVEFA